MKVKLLVLVEFDVAGAEGDELTEDQAKEAASQAIFDYLTFRTISGANTDTKEVEVHVDGYGTCLVRLGEDHE